MMPQLIEIIARERYQALLQEAEQKRLAKMLPPKASTATKIMEQVSYWLGTCLVVWGLKLQGVRVVAVPQLSNHKPYSF